MGKFVDLTGQRFGRLIVLERAENAVVSGKPVTMWKCQCDCGSIIITRGNNLTSGVTSSCGCYHKDVVANIGESKLQNLIGQKFGRLTILGRAKNKGKRIMWLCQCDCGNTCEVSGSNLKSGTTKSCGCLAKEILHNINQTHGKSNTRLYKIWCKMKERCYNKNHKYYHNYGGRGIIICDEWLNDFTKFYNWAIASGYKDDLTIDRIDVNGNYEPSNCRWATKKEQSNNTRYNRYIFYKGKSNTVSEWSDILGIPTATIYARLNKLGWSVDRTLSTIN